MLQIIWDFDDDPMGNVQHIAEHGIDQDEVTEVLEDPEGWATSRTSGLPIVFGSTSTGKYIAVIFEQVAPDVVYPVTAYEVED